MSKPRAEVVLFTIEHEPLAVLVDLPPEGDVAIQLGDRVFRDARFGAMNGFCDFLRGPSGIVGIRFSPYPATEFLASLVASGDRIIATGSPIPSLCFYPRGQQHFDKMRSGDQDMVKNYILKSEDGTYAVTFAVDLLSPEDYSSLCILVGKEKVEDIHDRG